ncbi:hypothetical protein, partial [Streptomyces asiaticus]|uniref:hypothetical protein n=1 Tax=Streptomyces asiaticus TaxID=114695 RepID=UPI00382CD753
MPKVNARYVDTPSTRGRGSFEEKHSEDAVNHRIIPLVVPLSCSVYRDSPEAFTESLILAQDER